MHILFIAPRLPLPADTGAKIRTLNILKQVSKNYKVDFVCFSFEEEDLRHSAELEKMGVKVKLVKAPLVNFSFKLETILFNPLPFSVVKYYSPEMEEVLFSLRETTRYDIVHIDHVHMAHYQACFSGITCILDEHNVEYKILERCAQATRSLAEKFVYFLQAKKMKKFEAEKISNFSDCLAVSEDDCRLLKELPGSTTPVHVIPNGVDTRYFQTHPDKPQNSENALVFTGSMDWLPNDNAVCYFAVEILPLILKSDPTVRFYVVGRNPSTKIKSLAAANKNILVTGMVDDVRPFIQRSKIFVVPLRIGGGTRLKILEAMSMQKAIVSTTIGAEGIEYSPEHNIVIADKPEYFAKRTLELLADNSRIQTLGLGGRRLVCGKYDWDIIGQKLNTIYREEAHV